MLFIFTKKKKVLFERWKGDADFCGIVYPLESSTNSDGLLDQGAHKECEKSEWCCLPDLSLDLELEFCWGKGEEGSVLFIPSCASMPALLVKSSALTHFVDQVGDLTHTDLMICGEVSSKFQMTPLCWKCELLIPEGISIYLIATLMSEHALLNPIHEVLWFRGEDEFLCA